MKDPPSEQIETSTVITDLIEFPVYFNFNYSRIYDARNREVATVKTLGLSDDRRRFLGDWICETMNGYPKPGEPIGK
jgi:hypothetical protein